MKKIYWLTELRGGNLQNVCLPFLFLLLPIFFLTIKSWTNTIALIIALISIFGLVSQPSYYFSRRGKLFWVLFVGLTIPFACELIIQFVRSSLSLRALDGPIRFLLGAIAFVFLTRYERNFVLTKAFMLGCLLSVFATFLSVFFIEDYFWGDRAATYFVDPNSLPVYSGLLTCASLHYVNFRGIKVYYKYTLYISMIAMYLYICHVSQTRSAWIPAFLFIPYFLIRNTRSKWMNFAILVLVFKISIIIFYFQNPTFRNRVDYCFYEIARMQQGNFNSSLGGRVNLVLAEIELLKMEPIFGFEDGAIPPFEILKKRSPTLDLAGYSLLRDAGSHIEITAQLVRKGLIFGSLTVLALFIFPAFYFLKSQRKVVPEVRGICEMSLCIVLLILIPSFGIQVFNLKMYSTFWAIFLALFYAVTFTSLPKSRTDLDR
jgi:hypothetical protein